MRKLLLLLIALLTGVGGAWADTTVTVHSSSVQPSPSNASSYGTYSTGATGAPTYTTKDNSGLAGVTLTTTTTDVSGWNYAGQSTYYLVLPHTSTSETTNTLTLAAPTGYMITGYTMEATGWNSNRSFTFTANDGTGTTTQTVTNTAKTVSVAGINKQSTTMTLVAAEPTNSTSNWFSIKNLTVTVAPLTGITLTFDRAGNTVSDVTVNVKDNNGEAIPGLTVTLESTSFGNFKTGTATALTRTTNSVLAPDSYGNAGASMSYTFKIEGLPTAFSYNTASVDVYAMNGGGTEQTNHGDRYFAFDLSTGETESDLTSFASLPNTTDINPSDITTDDGLGHMEHVMRASDAAYATSTLWVKFTLTNNNTGCYAGISSVKLYKPSATVRYVISDETGVVFTSGYEDATVGETISTLPETYKRDNCSYIVTAKTLEDGVNTVNASVSYDLPFTLSQESDFENATWYFMQIGSGDDKYLYSHGIASAFTKGERSSSDRSDQWAFFGNPYDNFYIMNRNDGAGYYLQCMTPSKMQNSLNATWGRWTITKNGEGFTMRLPVQTYWFADNDNSWSTSSDGAAIIYVEEVPDLTTVDVTYDLYVGGEKVNTVVDEGVIANSAIVVPASLTSGYSTLCYDLATSGTVGDTDCTITVTGTLKSGVITNLSQLSNSKSYTLKTARGSLGSNGTQMVSTYDNSGYSASEFAVISYNGNYYLYSVDDSKFVSNNTQPTLTDDVSALTPLTLEARTTKYLFYMGMGNNGVNMGGGYYISGSNSQKSGIVINSWTTRDEGNQYAIIEGSDFDATDALRALEYYSAIAQLKTYTYGTAIGLYGLTGEFAGHEDQAAAVIEGLETQGYSADRLTVAQSMLSSTVLNTPQDGYYRLKNASTGKYLRVISDAQGGVVADVEAANAESTPGTIVKIETDNGHQFYTCQSREFRRCYQDQPITAPYGTHDKYALYSTQQISGQLAIAFAYGNGGIVDGYNYAPYVEGAYYAPDGNNIIVGSTSSAAAAQWIFEEVTDANITLNSDGTEPATYYATFCAPFSYTIGDGATAYTLEESGDWLIPTAVEGEVTAGTPVLLKGTSGTASLTIGTGWAATPVTGTALTGTYLAATIDGASDYVLGISKGVVGFYHWNNKALAANHAYIDTPESPVKGFVINWDNATGIEAVDSLQMTVDNKAIYNLSGQRLSKLLKGVNIVGGKKVLVK
ncbi:MAG: hypothetical protein IJ767_00400 [Bacteroidaceae bacterium]|nr:hypothetical protein [Bacteroidaceae bacterium]